LYHSVVFLKNSWPPLLWGAITFSMLFHFWRFLVFQMCQWDKFKFFLDIKNNGTLPLDVAYLERLSVWSPIGVPDSWNSIVTQFATKQQLKNSTHMLCLQIPCYQLYKKGLFSYVLTLKYMCHMSQFWTIINNHNGQSKNLHSATCQILIDGW
jgi:hypothetical protein